MVKRASLVCLSLVLANLLTGCSRFTYNVLQENERTRCLESAQGAALDECLQRQDTTFQEFNKQREQELDEH